MVRGFSSSLRGNRGNDVDVDATPCTSSFVHDDAQSREKCEKMKMARHDSSFHINEFLLKFAGTKRDAVVVVVAVAAAERKSEDGMTESGDGNI